MIGYNKKAVVFGVDARLVLLILALVSLSIAVFKQSRVADERQQGTQIQLKLIKARFLKHWEDLRMRGYYATTDLNIEEVAQVPEGYTETERFKAFQPASMADPSTQLADFTHPFNATTYKNLRLSSNSTYFNSEANALVVYNNYADGKFTYAISSYSWYIYKDVASRIYKTLKEYANAEGWQRLSNTTDSDIAYTSDEVVTFENDEFGENIRVYFIVEYNIDDDRPSDYIVNVILYSLGNNRQLDSTLPTNLAELNSFSVVNDDVFEIFSTKDIYFKAKADSLRREKELARKIELKGKVAYIEKVSECSTEETVSVSCDGDSDGDYDINDEKLLLNYNPYLQSELDTSGAAYLDSTVYEFDDASNIASSSETFINALGFPKYYAIDLFGNIINYQSNVSGGIEGPYSTEVWY